MKKKIFSILLIVTLLMAMLVGLTACGDGDDEEKSSKKSSSSSSVTKHKEMIEEFYEDFENRDLDALMDIYDIKGMNQYYKDVGADITVTKSELKESFQSLFDAYDEYDMSMFIDSDIYHITSKSDLKKAYKDMGEDTDDIDDLWEDTYEELVEEYDVFVYRVDYINSSADARILTILFNENDKMVNY